MSDVSAKPVIFISFSHKDEPDKPGPDEVAWLTFVQSFLAPVVKTGIFDIWVDEQLHGGDVIYAEILKKLAECDIFVLLVSRHSLASNYVVETEIATIRQRQEKGDNLRIFPIVLSPIPERALKQFKGLLLSPKDGTPLSLMSKNDREVAMAEIADDIAEVVEQISARKAAIKAESPTVLERAHTFDVIAKELAPVATPQIYVNTAHLPETPYERLVGREAQLKRLDEAWTDPNINILSLIAEGGAGKSALVNEWLKSMRADNYRGAETILGWSFYNQGTKERVTSADEFLNWALDKLRIEIETTSATAKGDAIAEALMKRRVLLVLDGCEPLQYGLDKQQGELKDQGLRALLRRFAATPPDGAHGLMVLTSRSVIRDIARWRDSSAPVVNVEELIEEAGADLLRDNGVWGTDKELRAVSREFGGHPLALGLLASFLKETQLGDVRRRDHIREFFADSENPRHDHARRVMESYEKEWLASQPVLLAIMQLAGIFDRPASADCLGALRKKPAIHGLTDEIVSLDEYEWQRAVSRLREVRLLAPLDPSARGALDAHPLVREWFGEGLRRDNETAWKAAHSRLYDHLRRTTKEGDKPSLSGLAPLYEAIAHGCRAGRYQEALVNVYQARICRMPKSPKREDSGGQIYAADKLGAFGSDLAAISWFFERPYERPEAAIDEDLQRWILTIAANTLMAQGRVSEALSIQRASLHRQEIAENWFNVPAAASNVCAAELLIGHIAAALDSSETAIAFGSRSGTDFDKIATRATRAAVLTAAGRFGEAERLFSEADQCQRERQPNYPLLYSGAGSLMCDLLRARGKWELARDRASKTLFWATDAGTLLDVALDTFTLAWSNFGILLSLVGQKDSLSNFADRVALTNSYFDEAVEKLQTSAQGDLANSLVTRSAFRRSAGRWDAATHDLDEVEEIAELGPMRLYLCDITIERARLACAKIEAFAPLNGLLVGDPPKPLVPDAA
ncbi:MAG TPA: TIR domain-containing protein, partial [Bryobacteraceae bacterium]|nr:TIR domain-containing protein [Bryobacteraceae bacterium]